MHISEHLDTIERWKNCPMANYVCPVGRYTKLETHTPRGKVFVLSLLVNGMINIDKNIIDRIYQCDMCRACEAIRRDNTSIPDLILAARRDIVDMNICPDYIVDLRKKVFLESNILNDSWVEMTTKKIRSSSKDLIIMTYESVYAKRSILALKTISNMTDREVIQINLGKFPAPASLLSELGFYNDSTHVLENLRRLIYASKRKKIIFITPYDLDLLSKMGVNSDFTPLEFNMKYSFEFVEEIIKSKSLITPKNVGNTVAYFDFCSSRHSKKFYEVPRQILGLISNLKVKEFIWSSEESSSCGGLALPYTFPDIASGIAKNVLNEVQKLEVNLLVSPCPHCVENLVAATKPENNIKIVDLWELLASVM